MKYLLYHEEQCEAKIIQNLKDTISGLEEFFANSDSGDKLTLEIIELTEEEYNDLPESYGC